MSQISAGEQRTDWAGAMARWRAGLGRGEVSHLQLSICSYLLYRAVVTGLAGLRRRPASRCPKARVCPGPSRTVAQG